MFPLITNNCLNTTFYKFEYKRKYDHPFVGSLFVNDDQYIKFCKNFEKYIFIEPRWVDKPNPNTIWAKQNGNEGWYKHETIPPTYPICVLGDVEIHYIHEELDIIKEKYDKRIKRVREMLINNLISDGKCAYNPVFLLSFADLMNDHTTEKYNEIINNFLTIDSSIYLTNSYEDVSKNYNQVIYVGEWDISIIKRDESHLKILSDLNKTKNLYKYIFQNYIVRVKNVFNI